jgi:hypothetical protein
MDVHPPHHGIHSWRDFLVHMGTICLGLLIAIGLEQSVEAWHRAQEHHELREALDRDSRQTISDTLRTEKYAEALIPWLLERMKQVRAALATHGRLGPKTPPPLNDFDIPEDVAFQAAKTSGALALLSPEETRAYFEADWVNLSMARAYENLQTARHGVQEYELEFRSPPAPADFSAATAEELHRYLDLLSSQLEAGVNFLFWSQDLRGVETALLRGERDLGKIQKAERSLHTPVGALTQR